MSCLARSKLPLLKRLSDGGWISCMFVNIICSPLHPRGTCQSLKVSDSNANICLATEAEWESLGHLHQRYSLVDRSHKVEYPRWNNGRAEGGLGMQIPHCTHPRLKQSILINISCNESLLVRKKLKLFCLPRGSPCFCLFLILVCVMSFSGRPSWKNGDKTSCNNGLKRTQLLCAVRSSWQSEQSEAKCAESPIAFRSTKQSGTAAHTSPRPQTFFYVRSTWQRAPSLLSEHT